MKTTFYYGTTLLATLLHSLCCVLPLLTTVLGATGTVPALAWLLPYQPLFWVLQAVVLAGAFYHVYASPHRASSRRLIWAFAVVSILLGTVPHTGWFRSERQTLAQAQVQRVFNTRQLTLKVDTPAHAEPELKADLRALKGVLPTQTSVRAGLVSVRYDRQLTNREAILSALRQRGYDVRLAAH